MNICARKGQSKTRNIPIGPCADGFEIGTSTVDEVPERRLPVAALVPGNLRRRVNLYWHHLRRWATLDNDNQCSDAAISPAALLTALDICSHKRVADISSRHDVCAVNREAAVRLGVVLVVQVDDEGALTECSGYALQLERLKACPAEQGGVCGGELA